jgi:predicted metalloprotease with PDZ domain
MLYLAGSQHHSSLHRIVVLTSGAKAQFSASLNAAAKAATHKTVPFFRGAVILLLLCWPSVAAAAEEQLVYRVRYDLAEPAIVHVTLNFPAPSDAPLTLIVPRTVPGGYAKRPYDPFVTNVKAYAADTPVEVRREPLGPRWKIGKTGERVDRVEYDVDVARMEREIFAASDSSKIRDGYVGLLGYSIFAFFDGWENRPLRLEVSGPTGWPVFSTLAPRVPAEKTTLTARAEDYYALADSQIVIGPKLQLRQIDGGVPLFLSVYAECDEDSAQEGALAREALDKVIAYFGTAPFSNYTVELEYLRPISVRHEYNFSMEHLNSGTFYLDTEHALTAHVNDRDRAAHRFNYAHHIAHSWIPKRAYGVGYLPFTWEMTPIIDTIWFNEGFGRYVAIEALAEAAPKEEAQRSGGQNLDAARSGQGLNALRGILEAAPEFIRRMSLSDLSREGSFLYSADFRVGQNLFARGALMAAEMDERIRLQTNGQKSLRDALRYLMDWSERNRRAFRTEELPVIFREATGVDTANILDRWMQPPVH